jgi:hypothetical protein
MENFNPREGFHLDSSVVTINGKKFTGLDVYVEYENSSEDEFNLIRILTPYKDKSFYEILDLIEREPIVDLTIKRKKKVVFDEYVLFEDCYKRLFAFFFVPSFCNLNEP